jgi:hypothetical protein
MRRAAELDAGAIPPARRMPVSAPARARRAASAAAAAAALAACGRDPVSPPGAAARTFLDTTLVVSQQARAYYGDTVSAFENEVFYWRDRVDWARHAADVRARVAAARTHGDLWRAAEASIDPWLVEAPADGEDLHSAFFPPDQAPGLVDSPADTTRKHLVVGDTLRRDLAPGPGRVAYLWFPHYAGKNSGGRVDSTQAAIRALDQSTPCGWVLDQRFNYGGDIAAMLSGLSPLIGDAPAGSSQNGLGGFVFADNSRGVLYLQNGRVGIYNPATGQRSAYGVRPTTQYAQRRPNTPVAILLSGITASAGELTTIAFRGSQVPYRTFGENTLGLTTGPIGTYLLPDSGYLNITASVMFDRLGRRYGDVLTPDEPVAGPGWRTLTPGRVLRDGDPVLAAAVRWLQAQPSCTGAPVASRGTDGARPAPAAAAAALPGEVKPSPLIERLSRYFLPRGGQRALVTR